MPTFNFLGFEIWIPGIEDLVTFVVTPLVNLLSPVIFAVWDLVRPKLEEMALDLLGVIPGVTSWIGDTTHPILGGIDLALGDTKAGVDVIPGNILGEHEGTRGVIDTGVTSLSLQTATEANLTRTESGLQIQGAQTALGSLFDGGIENVRGDVSAMDQGIAGQIGSQFGGFGRTDPTTALVSVQGQVETWTGRFEGLRTGSSPITPAEAFTRAQTWELWANVAYGGVTVGLIVAEILSLGQVDTTLVELLKIPSLSVWFETAREIARTRDRISILRPLEYYWNQVHTPNIPGYADMIRIYVKEAYLPEKWAELPAEMTEYFKWLGYSEFWVQRLWGAHWVLVPLGQLYDMYHRGLITKEELTTQIKYHDYELIWRDRLIEIAYTLIGRIDLRRGWEAGLIPDDELSKRYEFLGYSPDDAVLMADLHKRFALGAEFSDMSRQAVTDFVDGFIDEETLRANITALGFNPAVVEMRISAAKLRAEREYKREERALLTDLYIKDLIDAASLAASLAKLGYKEKWVSILVDRATVRKARTTQLATAALAKPLTLTLVTRAWKKGLISGPDAVNRLMMLGYSEADSRMILDVYREEEAS